MSFQSVLYLWFLQASTLSKGVLSPGASWVSHDRRADRDREIHTERKKSRKKTVAESSRQTNRQKLQISNTSLVKSKPLFSVSTLLEWECLGSSWPSTEHSAPIHTAAHNNRLPTHPRGLQHQHWDQRYSFHPSLPTSPDQERMFLPLIKEGMLVWAPPGSEAALMQEDRS